MPVKQLIEDIEKSITENGYTRLRFQTLNHQYFAEPEDITIVSRYFFRVITSTGEVLININQLESVELFGAE